MESIPPYGLVSSAMSRRGTTIPLEPNALPAVIQHDLPTIQITGEDGMPVPPDIKEPSTSNGEEEMTDSAEVELACPNLDESTKDRPASGGCSRKTPKRYSSQRRAKVKKRTRHTAGRLEWPKKRRSQRQSSTP